MFVAQHDCLIQVQAYKDNGKDAFDFNSAGIYQRENNCQMNLSGNLGARFQGSGMVATRQLPNSFDVQLPFLIFGHQLVNPNQPEGPVITFKRTAVSRKFYKLVSTYKHKFMSSPMPNFLSEIAVADHTRN